MTSTALAIPYQDTDINIFTDTTGEIWFCANDIAEILHLSNIRASLKTLDDDETRLHHLETSGGLQTVQMISEPGLYTLILRSRRPEARPFRRWITHDVIPSIRKHGTYTPPTTPKTIGTHDWALIIASGINDEGTPFTNEALYATPDNKGYTSLRSRNGKHTHTVSFEGPGHIDTFTIATPVPEHTITQAASALSGSGVNARDVLGLVVAGALVSPWRG